MVPFDSGLELLIAIVGEPNRTARKEYRRERDVERKRRVIASAEAAAHIGKLRVDARRLKRRMGFAQQVCDRLRGLIRRLHANDELEGVAAGVMPGQTALGLEKHWIHRLGLEFALQHQQVSLVVGELGADLLAISRGFGISRP